MFDWFSKYDKPAQEETQDVTSEGEWTPPDNLVRLASRYGSDGVFVYLYDTLGDDTAGMQRYITKHTKIQFRRDNVHSVLWLALLKAGDLDV